MASMQEREKKIKEEMDEICMIYKTDVNAQLLDLMQRGQKLLVSIGHATRASIHASKTLPHVRNRGNNMLEISQVPILISNISDVAFSENEVSLAAAVRMPGQGTKERRAIEEANERLCMRAEGTLAPVVRDAAEVQILSCNHLTAGLKAVNAGARCTIPRISENGSYSAAKLIGRCPSLAEPIQRGVEYMVYETRVDTLWPTFVDLTIEACNVGGALARADTFVEIAQKALAHSASSASWDDVTSKILRTKPPLAPLVPMIVEWVRDWSGGAANPHHLNSLRDFVQTVDDPCYTNINEATLRAILKVSFGIGLGGRARSMILKSLIGRTKSILVHNIAALGKGNGLVAVTLIEKELAKFDGAIAKILPNDEENKNMIAKVIGNVEIDAISYACGFAKKFPSVQECMASHFDAFLGTLGKKAVNPFAVGGKAHAPTVAAAPKCATRDLTKTGLTIQGLKAMAADKGFHIDGLIQEKKEKSIEGQDLEQYVLLAYEGSNVTLSQRKDKRRKRTMTLQHMVDNCVPVEQGDYSINTCKNNPLTKEDYEQAAMSYARVAMHETLTECVGLQGGVSMSLYPFSKRGVFANKAFKVGTLQLFPFPSSLKLAKDEKEDRVIRVEMSGCTFSFTFAKRVFPSEVEPNLPAIPYFGVKEHVIGNLKVTARTAEVRSATVSIPIYVNSKALKQGDELVLLRT